MPKPETSVDPIEAARQISENAKSELATLNAQLPGLQQTVVDNKTEEEQIQQRIQDRQSHFTSLQQALQTAQTAHKDAVDYASVASGTIGEMNAIQSAVARKGELDATHAQHVQTKQDHAAADEQDNTRLAVVQQTIQDTMTSLHDIHERMKAVETVKLRSINELGESLNASLMVQHEPLKARVEEAKAVLVQAQMDERQFLDSASAQLEAWPAYRQLRDALGVDSPLLRILNTELTYIDQLMTDAKLLSSQLSAPNGYTILPENTRHLNWKELFQITYHDLEYTGFGSIGMLQERRDSVAAFLEQCKQAARS